MLRAPLAAERPVVAELVLQSDCGMLEALFGSRVRSLLEHLQSRAGNPYSASNTLVIAEGTEIVAAAVGALARETRRGNLRTAGQLAGWYGLGLVPRLPALVRAGRAVDRLSADDFYLSHIAVLPAHRGRGIGRVLLQALEERATHHGARRVVLDVEENASGAQAFYVRLGYEQISVLRIDLGSRGRFDFRRLARRVGEIGGKLASAEP